MRYFAALLLTVAFVPVLASAQITGVQDVVDNGVNLTVTPTTPRPNQSVSAILDSSSIDLDTANISWSVNGKRVQNGQGQKTFSFTAGSAGSQTIVSASISSRDGTSLVKSITISPASVDLLWEGEGYAPPFYEGRTMWANEGQITFLAVPNVFNSRGVRLNPNNLIYKWTQNDTILGESSGAGKNTLTLSDTILSLPETIEVDVLTDRDTTVATASINLTPGNPKLLIYEDNPLYGLLFNNEVGNQFTTAGKEFTFAAFPLSFATTIRSSANLSYNWQTGGSSSGTKNEVTYRTPESGTGTARIGVTVNSSNAITQSASRNFLVQFGSQGNL